MKKVKTRITLREVWVGDEVFSVILACWVSVTEILKHDDDVWLILGESELEIGDTRPRIKGYTLTKITVRREPKVDEITLDCSKYHWRPADEQRSEDRVHRRGSIDVSQCPEVEPRGIFPGDGTPWNNETWRRHNEGAVMWFLEKMNETRN